MHTNFPQKNMHTNSYQIICSGYANKLLSQCIQTNMPGYPQEHITMNQDKHSRICMSSKEWKSADLRRRVVAATTCNSIHKAATIASSFSSVQNASIIVTITCIIHTGTKSTISNPAQQLFWGFPSNG